MKTEEPSQGSKDPRRDSIARETKYVIEALSLGSSDLSGEVSELSQVGEDRDGESVVQDDPAGETGASGVYHKASLPELADSFVEPVYGAFWTNCVAKIGSAKRVLHRVPLRNSGSERSLRKFKVGSPEWDASTLIEAKLKA